MSGEPTEDEWPLDTLDCVFLARAIDQIGKKQFQSEWTGREVVSKKPNRAALQRLAKARTLVTEAIGVGKLKLCVRLVGTTDGRLGHVTPKFRSPEGWIEAVKVFQVETRDVRPWVSVRVRRGNPQPHWLFATSASLEGLLAPQSRSIPTETEVLAIIRDKIALGIKFGRREQDDICARECAGFQRGQFRELVDRKRGQQNRGRPPTNGNAP